MQFNRNNLPDEILIELFKEILLPRMIEEKMLLLLRQGKVSKWFSGIGQEAISVGATFALQAHEWIMPLHRNLGVFTTRKMPLPDLINQWQGALDGYSKGRERSFHFGNKEHFICGMISHLGPQLSVADGAALAYKLKNEEKVFLGDSPIAQRREAIKFAISIFKVINEGIEEGKLPFKNRFSSEELNTHNVFIIHCIVNSLTWSSQGLI